MNARILPLIGILLLGTIVAALLLSHPPTGGQRPTELDAEKVTTSAAESENPAPPPVSLPALPSIEELKYVDKLMAGGRAAPLRLADALVKRLHLSEEERATIEMELDSVRQEFEQIASSSIQERPYLRQNESMLPGGSAFYLPPVEGSTEISARLKLSLNEILGSQRSDLLWSAIESSLEQHPIIRGFGRYSLDLTFEGAWQSSKTKTVRYYEALTDPVTGEVIGPFTLMAINKIPPQYRFLFKEFPPK